MIDRVDLARPRPAGLRFRTQHPSALSTLVDYDTVSVPSDKGNYRTLIRVLTPALAAPWDIAQEPWATNVLNWQIKTSMIGSQVHKTFRHKLHHNIVTVLHIGRSRAGNGTLRNSNLISAAPESIGACALSFCFVVASKNPPKLRAIVNYTTPLTMEAHSRHLVADLEAGKCYSVTSSVSGKIMDQHQVNARNNTLLFTVPRGGVQHISIVKSTSSECRV